MWGERSKVFQDSSLSPKMMSCTLESVHAFIHINASSSTKYSAFVSGPALTWPFVILMGVECRENFHHRRITCLCTTVKPVTAHPDVIIDVRATATISALCRWVKITLVFFYLKMCLSRRQLCFPHDVFSFVQINYTIQKWCQKQTKNPEFSTVQQH